jgi:hypothetical protein
MAMAEMAEKPAAEARTDERAGQSSQRASRVDAGDQHSRAAFPIFAEPIVEFMKGAEQLILVGPSHSGGLQDSLSRPSIRGWDGRPGSSRRRREGTRSAVASERIQKARCS